MSKGENNMEYKKSSIFSDKQKIDNRNLCLYLNFKNEKTKTPQRGETKSQPSAAVVIWKGGAAK